MAEVHALALETRGMPGRGNLQPTGGDLRVAPVPDAGRVGVDAVGHLVPLFGVRRVGPPGIDPHADKQQQGSAGKGGGPFQGCAVDGRGGRRVGTPGGVHPEHGQQHQQGHPFGQVAGAEALAAVPGIEARHRREVSHAANQRQPEQAWVGNAAPVACQQVDDEQGDRHEHQHAA